MGLTLITAATSNPITAEDLKTDILNFQNDLDNISLLEFNIEAATNWLQESTARQFMQATWMQTFDCWPGRHLVFDMAPVASVSSVKYYDVDGVQQTLSSSYYWVDTRSRPPRLTFKPSFSEPSLEDGRPGAIEVTFVAGYANVAAVPAIAKLAIKQLVMYWYNQREALAVKQSSEPAATAPAYSDIPFGVFSIANQLNASGYT